MTICHERYSTFLIHSLESQLHVRDRMLGYINLQVDNKSVIDFFLMFCKCLVRV